MVELEPAEPWQSSFTLQRRASASCCPVLTSCQDGSRSVRSQLVDRIDIQPLRGLGLLPSQRECLQCAYGCAGLADCAAASVSDGRSLSPLTTFRTLTLVLCGVLSPVRGAMYVLSEIVAAIAASAVLEGLVPGNIAVSPCARGPVMLG